MRVVLGDAERRCFVARFWSAEGFNPGCKGQGCYKRSVFRLVQKASAM